MKLTVISILIATALIVGAIVFTRGGSSSGSDIGVTGNNVSIINGKQVIIIRAKGGYQPRKSVAQAGLPTVLRFDTNGTFDCSSSVRIPSLGISKILPQSGETDIDLGLLQVGTLQGMCGMGMYRFELEFKS